jgi:lysophospholipase L1-like esterase
MKNLSILLKLIFWISIALNILLLTLITIYFFRNKDKIKQNIIIARGVPYLIMFGDSHTANATWTRLLSSNGVVSFGYNGFNSEQLKSILMARVLPLKPRFCFIQGGGNDIRSHCYDKNELIMNIKEMIDSLQINNVHPVLQSLFHRYNVQDYNTQVDSINLLLMQLSKEEKIVFLDVNKYLINERGLRSEYTIEGIHLNAEGYKVWAKVINDYLATTIH